MEGGWGGGGKGKVVNAANCKRKVRPKFVSSSLNGKTAFCFKKFNSTIPLCS